MSGGPGGDASTGRQAEFAQDVGHVGLDRALADVQLPSYLAVSASGGDLRSDLAFPRSKTTGSDMAPSPGCRSVATGETGRVAEPFAQLPIRDRDLKVLGDGACCRRFRFRQVCTALETMYCR
jgi:hypothetical protein